MFNVCLKLAKIAGWTIIPTFFVYLWLDPSLMIKLVFTEIGLVFLFLYIASKLEVE